MLEARIFWGTLIAFTSPEFSKTEVRYLEHAFFQRLSEDKKVTLMNGVETKQPVISREMKDTLDEYIDRASDVLLSIGYDFLDPSKEVESEIREGVEVYCKGSDAKAVGYWNGNGVLIKKDSLVRKSETLTLKNAARKKRAEMIASGLLREVPDSNSYVLTADYFAPSASMAADIVQSRTVNGLIEWKTRSGKTLKQL